ncbi:MAG: putative Ig domain-containing protein [Oryzomonas sp.]|uniref:putative Ig domain-containing protein n=1 Tax=Oryzomonas sp. TaxID=2855186 RepID=UPI002851E68A|nr:putative Ig domain-containing protein [Oryzomonas sp.]MDR3579648.1 putative Ig domain-containing protein [Oryzomonas sp.]
MIGSKSTSVTITMPLPTIMGTPATSATAGVPYSFTPTATNAASFSISGTLPPGLGFNTTTGTLSGTPTTVGTYGNIIITDTDASGSASLPAFSITVAKGSPSITALPAASGINLGQALSNSSLTGGTGSVPGTFTFMTPSTVPSSAGTYSAGITFTPSDTTDYNSVSGSVNVAVASVTANGGCGTSNGVTFLVAPGANLCSTGTPTSVSGSGPWNWSCNGTGGGTTASCSAAMAAAPTTPVATATVPTVNFSGAIPGTTFTILRSAGGSTPVQIASGTSTTITDNSVLLPNTIYTYLVSSDTDPTQTTVMTIHTPMYNGWNIVAVPYQTTGVNPATFFGSPVSAVYQWIPSGATPESSNSVLGSYTTVSSLTPGYGYFVEASNSSTLLTYSGTAGPASATVTLKPGWTMIANPNTTNKTNIGTNWMIDGTALSSAIFAGTIGSSLYWWNGTTYDFWTVASNPQIEPWKAYWILNLDLVNHTLTIQ